MADLIPRRIWHWVSKGWRTSMEDLADRIDDLICTFEGGNDTTMDTVAMYMFGWMLVGLVVLGVGRYAYGRFISKTIKETDKKSEASDAATNSVKPVVPEPATVEPLTAAKPLQTAAPKGSTTSGGGKYVPPTPPVRKRLGSKSGSGVVRPSGLGKSKGSAIHPPPTATGPESESVKWVNELFLWLYSDLEVVHELLNAWILSLNEFTKKSVAEHGVGVEFVRVLPETPPPTLNNVFCECAPNDDVTITCDCEATPALQLKAFRQKSEKVEVSHYRLNVNRFRARLSIVAITEKLLCDIKCDGWPEVKVALAQVGSIKNNLDESQLQDVISEIVTSALRQSSLHYHLGQHPNCPRLSRHVASPSHLLPLHYDAMLPADQVSRRLLVKVIKATGLGTSEGCAEPFCVVEVDEPAQRNQTVCKKDTRDPTWEEHFLFDVTEGTSEVLLEVYDKSQGGNKFLGLGIVSMDELYTNPSQRQIISLQGAPHHDLPVSGTLTVEFLLIEGVDLPASGDKPYKVKETLRSVSPSGQLVTRTKTTLTQQTDKLRNGGDGITDAALKEIERTRGLQPNKSTLIIHSVQRNSVQMNPRLDKFEREAVTAFLKTAQPTQPQMLKVEMSGSGTFHEVDGEPGSNAPTSETEHPQEQSERDRGRKKKRDFFGTIRRRLNRSKGRSRSVGPSSALSGGVEPSSAAATAAGSGTARSISADRAPRDSSLQSTGSPQIITPPTLSDTNQHGSYLSVPGGLREGSARSSLSEASGISGASSRTYVNEASTLVLETIENGIKKYYLVPLSMAQKSKWRKKGSKLHIFNDHTFIAKHLSGGTICEVCKKPLPRRLGKQGYECRDCLMKCHKQCHVKAELTCPNSNIHNIELHSIAQSPFALRKLGNNNTLTVPKK